MRGNPRYGVPWQQPVNPCPDIGPGVFIKPCWPETNTTSTIKVGKEPSMVERCRQRRDELKAELETLEAMIEAAEKAGAK